MVDDKVQAQIRDCILVLDQIVKRQNQQGIRLPDAAGEAMKRLTDSLLTEADHSALRLAKLKGQRGLLITQRAGIETRKNEQNWLLANPKGQPAALLARTREQSVRTASEYDACVKQLAAVEAKIAELTNEGKAAKNAA
jgi:hypothetical protein